jgi:hypothetical protein
MWPTATAVGENTHSTKASEAPEGRHRPTGSIGSESVRALCRPFRGLVKHAGTCPHGLRRGPEYAARQPTG